MGMVTFKMESSRSQREAEAALRGRHWTVMLSDSNSTGACVTVVYGLGERDMAVKLVEALDSTAVILFG